MVGVANQYVLREEVTMQDLVRVNESHSTANVANDAQSLAPLHAGLVDMQQHIQAASSHLLTHQSTHLLAGIHSCSQQLNNVWTL